MTEKQTALMQQNKGIYTDLFYMCFPLLAMAIMFYGFRVALLCATAVITANLCDRLVALLRRTSYTKHEWSSEAFAFMLTLLMPATVSYYVVIAGTLATVMIGKEAFGGYGAYPFHPTAVGYATVAVSWPNQVFQYPEPVLFNALPLGDVSSVTLVESPLHVLKTGGLPTLDNTKLLLGNYAGPMGITALLVILACALFLWNRKRIQLHVPVVFLLTCAVIVFFAPRLGDVTPFSMPWTHVADRLNMVKYEIGGGGILFAAVFLLTDPVILPKTRAAQVVYCVLLGIMTMMFRYYGNYETGVCFALLAVNSISGWVERTTQRIVNRKGVIKREC